MDIADIKWGKPPEGTGEYNYQGRNGMGKCRGLSLNKYQDRITLLPINSKGSIANCLIDVPIDKVAKLAGELIPLDKILDAVYDRLPTLLGIDPVLDEIVEEKLKEVPECR